MKKCLKSACVDLGGRRIIKKKRKAYDAYQYEDNAMLMENIEALSNPTEGGTTYPEPVNCGTIKCRVHTIFPWQWGRGHLCQPCCSAYATKSDLLKEKDERAKEQCWCTGPRQDLDAGSDQRYGWCFPKSSY